MGDSAPERKVFVPDSIEDHERPPGRMMANAGETAYMPLRSLEEAKAAPDGVVILQGDDGGQIYVICRASQVSCGAETLEALLCDLDEMAWPGNDPDMRRVFYERLPTGAGVAGGMGGGQVTAEPWIHNKLVAAGPRGAILDVLQGKRTRLKISRLLVGDQKCGTPANSFALFALVILHQTPGTNRFVVAA